MRFCWLHACCPICPVSRLPDRMHHSFPSTPPFYSDIDAGKYPGDDSPVVWGVCGHAFHLQCINKWLSSQTEQRCPFCRRSWEYKSAGPVQMDAEEAS